jgi:hypothetical protein
MLDFNKLPLEVQQAIITYGPSQQLDEFLDQWRKDLEAHNWLNYLELDAKDQTFTSYHNEYRKQRGLI